MKSVTGQSNDTDTHIDGASGENTEKAGWRAGSVQTRKQSVLRNRRRKSLI